MTKRNPIIILAIMFLIAIPLKGICQDMVENMGNGSINWTGWIIEAKGIGVASRDCAGQPCARPGALLSAKLDAMRNILEVIKGIRIDSTTVVKNFAVENDVIMSKVDGVIRGYAKTKEEYMSDGTVEVTLQVNMRNIAELVIPQPNETAPDMNSPPPSKGSLFHLIKSDKVFTGMVVDARGLNAKPAMTPKIIDENGQEVYGSQFVTREYVIQQGMSGYAKDIEAAKKNERVSDNPLVVKGIKTDGPEKANIVISNSDATAIRKMSENLSFMKKCKVIIVVD